jgi:hypothetical protein
MSYNHVTDEFDLWEFRQGNQTRLQPAQTHQMLLTAGQLYRHPTQSALGLDTPILQRFPTYPPDGLSSPPT